MEYDFSERRIRNFWKKVNKTDTCWLWTGCISRSGYGLFGVTPTRTTVPHRFAYEFLVCPIPEGLTLDHLCKNRLCVNPEHLEPVTLEENQRRGNFDPGWCSTKTHCPQGHPYDETNTYRHNGHRACIQCKVERTRQWRKDNPEKDAESRHKSQKKFWAKKRAEKAT